MTNSNQTRAPHITLHSNRDLSFIWTDGPVTVLLGDVRRRLAELESESVQCVVTSPPYWGLRDYRVAGQLGLEATPELYVDALAAVFCEVRRTLRRDGTVWLNLGDSYAGSWGAQSRDNYTGNRTSTLERGNRTKGRSIDWSRSIEAHPHETGTGSLKNTPGLKAKDLIGIPWRVALALQASGWYLRSDIIWSKPNPMPESVTDRPTKAHEYLFLLSDSERYYYDADAIREPAAGGPPFGDRRRSPESAGPGQPPQRAAKRRTVRPGIDTHGGSQGNGFMEWDPADRNKRSVWEVPTQPYPEAHFATFPEALVEPCVLAGSRQGDVVLDPFAGSGTTLAVARRLGRRAIGIELQADYLPLIQRRVREAALPLVEVMDGLPEQSFSTLNEV